MITGFNTDIPHEGVTYHVQTEDKGLDTPLILSLVYVGGAIIASKRTRYDDLIKSGFDELVLTERLQRQHKLICAAILAGRIEDLKRMGARDGSHNDENDAVKGAVPVGDAEVGSKRKKPPSTNRTEARADATASESGESNNNQSILQETSRVEDLTTGMDDISAKSDVPASTVNEFNQPEGITPPVHEKIFAEEFSEVEQSAVLQAPFVAPPKQSAPPTQIAEQSEAQVAGSEDLYLTLLDDEGDFRAGQLATVKVHVGRGAYGRSPVHDASVTVKVLGTSFRPLILATSTDERGIAVLRALLPRFTSGRAAIIIRAVSADDAAELRRIIHQA